MGCRAELAAAAATTVSNVYGEFTDVVLDGNTSAHFDPSRRLWLGRVVMPGMAGLVLHDGGPKGKVGGEGVTPVGLLVGLVIWYSVRDVECVGRWQTWLGLEWSI